MNNEKKKKKIKAQTLANKTWHCGKQDKAKNRGNKLTCVAHLSLVAQKEVRMNQRRSGKTSEDQAWTIYVMFYLCVSGSRP